MKNRLCELLGIRYPIIQGAMQWLSLPPLAAAVSQAGGLGIITAASYPTAEELAAAIREMKSMTTEPFAVNISLLPGLTSKEKIDRFVETIAREKPPVIETAGRSPEEYLPDLRKAGLTVIHKVPSVRFAHKAVSLGVDAVTVVGFECGGHPGTGDSTSMVQTALAARELPCPVIAGGGIADGAGLAAALCLGADGAIMGTRFIASEECPVHPNFKNALCAARESDSVIIERSHGFPLRVFRNRTADRVLRMEREGAPVEEIRGVVNGRLTKIAYDSGDVENCAFPMGECAGLIDAVLPAAEIIRKTVRQAQEILSAVQAGFEYIAEGVC